MFGGQKRTTVEKGKRFSVKNGFEENQTLQIGDSDALISICPEYFFLVISLAGLEGRL